MNKPINGSDAPTPGFADLLKVAFDQLGYQQLNGIKCEVEGSVLTLSGQLKSFYLKQIAQTVAVNIPGVSSVENLIEVQ